MTYNDPATARLENDLNSFDADTRAEALCDLAARADSGDIALPPIKGEVNLHFHTFFSYNANGWSPSRIAWESRKYGLAVAGIVDFDVLDGMEEFLAAGEIVGLRTVAALETRVFFPEYADQVLGSPNEPGISYFMAAGCHRLPDEGSPAAETLNLMREMAKRRNIRVMERVNEYLDRVRLDYDADVLPLTPSGNATERHMLAAYDSKSRRVFGDDETGLAVFWANALGVPDDEAKALLADTPRFHEKMRMRLMKYGGVGYVRPSSDTFPDIDLVIQMILGMDALPMYPWLDGTNPGEADIRALLDLLASKGVVSMNLIPDRNWNLKDPADKLLKLQKLAEAVEAAWDMDLPLCVGTEMNKAGLPFVDDFSAPELEPHVEDFLAGAYFFWGHTFLARNAGLGCASPWARSHFGDDRAKKNSFYEQVGRLAEPAARVRFNIEAFKSAPPSDILNTLRG